MPIEERRIELSHGEALSRLCGEGDENLRTLESEFGVQIIPRGNVVTVRGPRAMAHAVGGALEQLDSLAAQGLPLDAGDIVRAVELVASQPDVDLAQVIGPARGIKAGRKRVRPRSLQQRRYLDAIERHDVVFAVGPAGTGKTYLAVATGIHYLLTRRVRRIVLTRPAVEAGERLGFLPGDMVEKVNPYLRPLYDAMHDMVEVERAQALIERGDIEIAPLAFMRGRTLHESFVILDEAQNTTREQMKMLLTRLGPGSKAVITGDITQVDLPPHQVSGLVDAIEVLGGVEGISVVRFTSRDVVRHRLVQRIIDAYETHEAARAEDARQGGGAATRQDQPDGARGATSHPGGKSGAPKTIDEARHRVDR